MIIILSSLFKLRKIGTWFRNSPTLEDELEQACDFVKIPRKTMIRPVDTRWNTFADVIPCALELRPALERVMSHPKHSKGKGNLARLKLSSVEWGLLAELKPMLKVFSRLYLCTPSF